MYYYYFQINNLMFIWLQAAGYKKKKKKTSRLIKVQKSALFAWKVHFKTCISPYMFQSAFLEIFEQLVPNCIFFFFCKIMQKNTIMFFNDVHVTLASHNSNHNNCHPLNKGFLPFLLTQQWRCPPPFHSCH